MYNSTIMIENVEKAREFVDCMNKYPNIRVNLKSGNYCIDAHSIIGVISLDISNPIGLYADGEIRDDFINDIKPYVI